jgi:hypothetical protein
MGRRLRIISVVSFRCRRSTPFIQRTAGGRPQIPSAALLMHRTNIRRLCLGGGTDTELNTALALFLLPCYLLADRSDPVTRQTAQDVPYPNRNAPLGLQPPLDGARMHLEHSCGLTHDALVVDRPEKPAQQGRGVWIIGHVKNLSLEGVGCQRPLPKQPT